jgi:lysophospholipase L1-like esterase
MIEVLIPSTTRRKSCDWIRAAYHAFSWVLPCALLALAAVAAAQSSRHKPTKPAPRHPGSTHPSRTAPKKPAPRSSGRSSAHAASTHSRSHTPPAHGRASGRYANAGLHHHAYPSPAPRRHEPLPYPVYHATIPPPTYVPPLPAAEPTQSIGTALPSSQAPVASQQTATSPAQETTQPTLAPTPVETAQIPASDEGVLPGAVPGTFQFAHALDHFFRDLAAHQSQAASATSTDSGGDILRILQFGDSHTAADYFSGEMRARLQATFGNGGLGYQFPGHPFAGYRLAGSSRAQSAGWVTQGNHFTELGDAQTGLGGIAISTSRPDETVTLTTTCQTLQVQYLRQAGGGHIDFSDNGTFISTIDTGDNAGDTASLESAQAVNSARGAGTMTYSCTPGVHDFELTTLDDAPVRLLGLVTEQPGITYECLGINGAVAPLILRWDQQLFADYLRQRRPALIVLAYGTNESTASPEHDSEYVAQLRQVVRTLHSIVPEASILMLGPYDREVRSGRGRHAYWSVSRAIDRIIDDQREVCRTEHCAFYDERARMGGPGAMTRWTEEGLAQGDHTHLTGAGYRLLADALYRDLMAVYNTFLQAPPSNSRMTLPRTRSNDQPSLATAR